MVCLSSVEPENQLSGSWYMTSAHVQKLTCVMLIDML